MKQTEAIKEVFLALGGTRSITEIKNWIEEKYGPDKWKDFGTTMADMVPKRWGGNASSTVPEEMKILRRADRGYYFVANSGEFGE